MNSSQVSLNQLYLSFNINDIESGVGAQNRYLKMPLIIKSRKS